jgi:hypothetical protein
MIRGRGGWRCGGRACLYLGRLKHVGLHGSTDPCAKQPSISRCATLASSLHIPRSHATCNMQEFKNATPASCKPRQHIVHGTTRGATVAATECSAAAVASKRATAKCDHCTHVFARTHAPRTHARMHSLQALRLHVQLVGERAVVQRSSVLHGRGRRTFQTSLQQRPCPLRRTPS